MSAESYLVTGGAGFLGINLVRYLLARGHTVRSLDIAPFEHPEQGAVEAIQGDIRDPATVERAMAGVDLVVHCAAALPLYTPEEIFSTDVDGTRLLLESAQAHQVARFIHVSSTAVYGIPNHHPIYEDDRRQGRWSLRRGQGPGRAGLSGVSRQRSVRSHPPPQKLRRAGTPWRVRAPLRLGL